MLILIWKKIKSLFKKEENDSDFSNYAERPSPEALAFLIKSIEDSKKPKKRKYTRRKKK